MRTNPTKAETKGLDPNTMISFVPMESVGEYGGLCLGQLTSMSEGYNGFTYFRDGDIIVAKITPCFENGKGAIAGGLENGIGFGTTELHVLRPHPEVDNRYLFYVTISHPFRNIGTGYMYGAGGQKRVPEDFIRNLKHPIPSINEQLNIVAFLDRETAGIDALIAKKERQIELLQEKRAALISHVVTKGLDSNVKLKDSGVEWLGEIPEHWAVKRLKFVFKNFDYRRIPLSAEERSYMEKIYPYYGASGIIDSVDKFILDEPLLLVAEDGANLLSRSTPLAFIAEGKYWVNNHAHILKPTAGSLLYWEGVLQTYDYTPLISGAAQPKLTAENLGDISLPVPPEKEQYNIANFIDREVSRIDALTKKVEESIATLQEYRIALISAAVTGKIDVCEEVA
jgi:type I restriction enzyme S subunit